MPVELRPGEVGPSLRAFPPTLNHVFYDAVEKFDHPSLLSWEAAGNTCQFSTAEFKKAVLQLAQQLGSLRLGRGARVAVLSENRPEWHIADFAILLSELVSVPIYPTFSPQQIRFVLEHCGAEVLIVSTAESWALVSPVVHTLPDLRAVYAMDSFSAIRSPVTALQTLFDAEPVASEYAADLRRRALAVDPTNLATIVYTSGTTGAPKGVMLTHGNIADNLAASIERLGFVAVELALSVLPLAHVFERLLCYGYFECGIPIAYGDPHDLAELLNRHKPTAMGCVPRILEKIRENVMAQISAQSVRRQRVAKALLRVGEAHIGEGVFGRQPTWLSRAMYCLADAFVYRRLRRRLGGNLRYLVCGGARAAQDLEEFFLAAGYRVLQGYGLTETSPVVSLSPFSAVKPGTVGKPLSNVKIAFGDDGEILVQGSNVTTGYYREPALTEAAFRDGWFCTGDLGSLDADGYLVISGRKKELIVTSGGKNIHPAPIEEQLCRSPMITRAFVVGDGRKFVSALIVPEPNSLARICGTAGIGCIRMEDASDSDPVREIFFREIAALQQCFSAPEQIRNFAFINENVLTDPEIITPTQKVRRAALESRFAHLIDRLYLGSPRTPVAKVMHAPAGKSVH